MPRPGTPTPCGGQYAAMGALQPPVEAGQLPGQAAGQGCADFGQGNDQVAQTRAAAGFAPPVPLGQNQNPDLGSGFAGAGGNGDGGGYPGVEQGAGGMGFGGGGFQTQNQGGARTPGMLLQQSILIFGG